MGALLILGRDEDLCCRLVRQELTQAGREVVFLPEDKLLPQMAFAWTPDDGGGGVRYGDQHVCFSDADGLLYRFYGLPVTAEEYQTRDGQYVSSEWNALFMAWLHQRQGPVANHLRPELWYKTRLNVPELASLVPDIPFRLPRTLVTTRGDTARDWCRNLGQPAVYAAMTGSATYRIDDETAWERLALLSGTLPLSLTEVIAGQPCEAYIVGDAVLLVGPDGARLPPASEILSSMCAAVGTSLGLTFFQLSLVEGTDCAWYCLGLDRMPLLLGCGPEAQQEIARRLAAFLSGQTPEGERSMA